MPFLSLLGNQEHLESQILILILPTLNHQQLAFLSFPCARRGPELASPIPYSLKQPTVIKRSAHFRTTAFKGTGSGDETISANLREHGGLEHLCHPQAHGANGLMHMVNAASLTSWTVQGVHPEWLGKPLRSQQSQTASMTKHAKGICHRSSAALLAH